MKFKAWLKKYLLTGLIVVVPITITLYIIQALIGIMDDFLTFVPKAYVSSYDRFLVGSNKRSFYELRLEY